MPPKLRAQCPPRPCPFVSCQYHLYLDVGPDGAIHYNRPDEEPPGRGETCALDVAARGGVTYAELADLLGSSVRRVRAEVAAAVKRFVEVTYDVLLVGRVAEREGYESLGDGGYRRLPIWYD